jgi:cell division protein FtsN
MEDEYEDEFYVSKSERRQQWRARVGARISTWLGAALALMVIGGLTIWSYQLGQRDASAVPVIRAALDPAKVQPDDPGGAVVAHQDITSFTASDGANASPELNLAAPPERPAEEDVEMGRLQEPYQATDETSGQSTGETVADDSAKIEPLATDATEQAPSVSPVAPTRPGDLKQRMADARNAESEDARLASLAAASAVQIQLGAFPDRNMTKSEWAQIYKANEDILSGRALVVQSTISGGRRFFRLRVGPFKDKVEAKNVCRALQARGQDCLVAVNG